MSNYNESATAEEQKTISIKRIFDLPLSTVWKAWTEPESFKKWWGPKGFTCPHCTIDLKVGGKYLNSMKGPDGKEVWGAGTYKEIAPNKRIVYTDSFADSEGNIVPSTWYNMPEMPLVLTVTVTLEEKDGKTIMALKHVGIPAEMYDDCTNGWQSSFDKLEANLQ